MKTILCFLLFLLVGGAPLSSAENALFDKSNLAAWCIVPFDASQRGPEERAAMLEKMGLRKFVYDYRKEHIPQWDQEIVALKKHRIELIGWWFPGSLNEEAVSALELFKRHGVHPQLWISGRGGRIQVKDEADQKARIAQEVDRYKPICEAAKPLGCQVGIYNHGGWGGEPENMVAVVEALKGEGIQNVGIVYNLHHGHGHLDRLDRVLPRMLPHLLCFNLNGMDVDGEAKGRKILPLGVGTEDLKVLRLLRSTGYRGPVGILNHTNEDAEGRLLDNLDGLTWLLRQIDNASPGPRPKYRTSYEGKDAVLTPIPAAIHGESAVYRWKLGAPLLNLPTSEGGAPHHLLDPTAVRVDSSWHVFAGGAQYVAMKELTPGMIVPHMIKLSAELHVPQVFLFRPTKQWQMVGQLPDTTRRYPKTAPVLSTNSRIDDPEGWTKPIVLDVPPPEVPGEDIKNWMDFYVIADDAKAHLFATSAGRLWRSETTLADYPRGWSKPAVALSGDFIYASHTYRQDNGDGIPRDWTNVTGVSLDETTKRRRQYQQSYVADRIEGPWRAEAATWEHPFAAPTNIRFTDDRWFGDLVHGEPLRTGNDERMILDREITQFIFHGHLRDAATGKMAVKSESVGLLEVDAMPTK